jgi:hypothetical protein
MLSKRILKSKRTACVNFIAIASLILVGTLTIEINDSVFKIIYYMFPTALCIAYLIILDGMYRNQFNAWSIVLMIVCTVCIFYLNLLPLDVAHSYMYYKLIWQSILNPGIIPNRVLIQWVYSVMIIVWTIQLHRLNKTIKETLW